MDNSDSNKAQDNAVFYFTKFITAYVAQKRNFTVLRSSVTKSSQLDSQPQSTVRYSISEQSVKVKNEQGKKVYPISNYDEIEWGETKGDGKKYIQISIKGERNPLIIHGKTEEMEFLYDGLKLFSHQSVETQSSKDKLEMFRKAVDISKIPDLTNIEIPPPPGSLNF